MKPRDDFRLGQPIATGPALDHLCPFCDGEGAACSVECFCSGLGVIAAEQAAFVAAGDPDPTWAPRPIPSPPPFTGKRCSDCAFRIGGPELDGHTPDELYLNLTLANAGDPFYCHTGMHHGAQGYVPRQRAANGTPIGHPICGGWLARYRRTLP